MDREKRGEVSVLRCFEGLLGADRRSSSACAIGVGYRRRDGTGMKTHRDERAYAHSCGTGR